MATSHVQVLVEFTKKLPGISSLLGHILLFQNLGAFSYHLIVVYILNAIAKCHLL